MKVLVWALGLVLVGSAAAAVTYETVPLQNTDATHFDAIIVLGWPTAPDGRPSQVERSRVNEAVRELMAGRADHIIMTGGAAHNQFVEAEAMAKVALEAGVPERDVIVEGRARNTIENIYYSNAIMEEHGWKSAEVVSSPSHLPRTALILSHYGFAWTTHAAPWPAAMGPMRIGAAYAYEIAGTAMLRWFGFRRSKFMPRRP